MIGVMHGGVNVGWPQAVTLMAFWFGLLFWTLSVVWRAKTPPLQTDDLPARVSRSPRRVVEHVRYGSH